MQVALKLTIVMLLAAIAAFAALAYVEVERQVQSYEQRAADELFDLGRGLAHAFHDIARREGPDRAREVISYADERLVEVTIRWVSLDPRDGSDPHFARERMNAIAEGRELMVVAREEDEGKGMLYAYVPIDGGGALELASSLRNEDEFRRNAGHDEAVAAALTAIIATVLASVVGVSLVGRPMQRLVAQARRVGAGDLSQRLELRQRDEIGELAHEMNAMCDRLEDARRAVTSETEERLKTVEQLRHADRLMTVGKLASGIAHELGTPLNVVSGHAKMIADSPNGPTVAGSAAVIRSQTERMTTIIRHLLDFARRREPQRAKADLARIAKQALALVAPLAQKQGVELRFVDGDADAETLVDPMQMEQVISNLVVNGIHSMKTGGGRLEVRVVRDEVAPQSGASEPPKRCVSLYVRDEGEGIPESRVGRVFEPFFTTKEVGEGTGLGLSVAYGIVTDHGGWISVESEPGKGSTFGVHLPDSNSRASLRSDAPGRDSQKETA